jgi:hypothetical protein
VGLVEPRGLALRSSHRSYPIVITILRGSSFEKVKAISVGNFHHFPGGAIPAELAAAITSSASRKSIWAS